MGVSPFQHLSLTSASSVYETPLSMLYYLEEQESYTATFSLLFSTAFFNVTILIPVLK